MLMNFELRKHIFFQFVTNPNSPIMFTSKGKISQMLTIIESEDWKSPSGLSPEPGSNGLEVTATTTSMFLTLGQFLSALFLQGGTRDRSGSSRQRAEWMFVISMESRRPKV